MVITWTLCEAIIIYITYILYVLWNLKTPRNLWSKWHTYSDLEINNNYCPPKISQKNESDKNILKTVKRRYEII